MSEWTLHGIPGPGDTSSAVSSELTRGDPGGLPVGGDLQDGKEGVPTQGEVGVGGLECGERHPQPRHLHLLQVQEDKLVWPAG